MKRGGTPGRLSSLVDSFGGRCVGCTRAGSRDGAYGLGNWYAVHERKPRQLYVAEPVVVESHPRLLQTGGADVAYHGAVAVEEVCELVVYPVTGAEEAGS